MKRGLLFVVGLCLAIVLGAQNADAVKVMKAGYGFADNHYVGQSMHKFKEYVEEKTKGEIRVDLYPYLQLGNDKEVLESIKVGVAHMNLPNPSMLTNFVKDFALVSLPYVFPSQEIANKVVDGEVGQALLKKLDAAGFVGLGFGDFGFRQLTNNLRPVTKLEDFKGLKIRTLQNPTHLAVFRALGANPTAMGWNEVFTALQQGVIDGQENPYMQIYTFKLNEVQKYLTQTAHCYDMVVFVLGKKFFNALSAEEQAILREATTVAQAYMRKSVKEEDAKALEGIKASGTQVTFLEPAEMERIRAKAMEEVVKQGEKINPQLFKAMLDAVAAEQK